MIRHLAVEIDATTEQQDKLRPIVRAAVKDLLPVRDKMLAARATGRELLTQQTIDRAALEKLRADQIATHEAVSKQLVQAVADAAEVLTPEQRRKISDMLPPGGWGHGPRPRETLGMGRLRAELTSWLHGVAAAIVRDPTRLPAPGAGSRRDSSASDFSSRKEGACGGRSNSGELIAPRFGQALAAIGR